MQLPERKKLFKNRHYRREEIEAELRRAQFEDQFNTEDSSSEDEELSESESEDEAIYEETSSSELEEADEFEKKDESEDAGESEMEDESEEEADESEKEDESEEADESEKEDESEVDESEKEDDLEKEEDELVNEEECNSEISVVYDKSNETLCDNTPIAKNNNVLINKNKSDVDDDSQSLYDSNFNLNDRQIQVIEWMVTRESKKPYGGIIATDMGTANCKITILMHLLSKSNAPNLNNTQSEGESDSDEPIALKGCTLILCSRSNIDDWIDCIGKNIQPGTLNVWVHYGKNRDISLHDLSQKDIVITTITLVLTGFRNKENNPLYQIKWHRIILDDIKVYNYKLQTSKALCQLSGICHWIFSSSTIINNDNDETMYSLIKFINYKPLNMLENWKKWMETNQTLSTNKKLRHLYYNKKIV